MSYALETSRRALDNGSIRGKARYEATRSAGVDVKGRWKQKAVETKAGWWVGTAVHQMDQRPVAHQAAPSSGWRLVLEIIDRVANSENVD